MRSPIALALIAMLAACTAERTAPADAANGVPASPAGLPAPPVADAVPKPASAADGAETQAGKFARFGTESAKYVAPGGGRIGMAKAEIVALYAGSIEQQAHEYTDGQYLRIKNPAGGSGVLVFETDGKGDGAKATEWRVGVAPQVDYVEGRS